MSPKFRIVGINFDHMHMGDLLRMAHEHPDAELVGICDEKPERMADAARKFSISTDRVFTDYRACLETTRPDRVTPGPGAAKGADRGGQTPVIRPEESPMRVTPVTPMRSTMPRKRLLIG